ncbi:biogenesis of lysosome-related organelles complex 1 subunit 6 isoform X2 [Mobula hypostoma]|uniref:biogenesis of lysosome-related organelles complex 1 subunit 6 isoform X2 n=1 Tax=Mobula hypostoma TaxID=723540 RepID=UPI002FC32AA7
MEPGHWAQGTADGLTAPAAVTEGGLEYEDSGELICVNQETVEKLTEGLISHYLPDLKQLKNALQELTQNQVVLLDTLEQQIAKFRECHLVLDINALRRALKLQQQRQREVLEHEQQREKELERERQLVAKPAKLS